MKKYSNLYDDPRGTEGQPQQNWKEHLQEVIQQLKGKGYKDSAIMAMVIEALDKS